MHFLNNRSFVYLRITSMTPKILRSLCCWAENISTWSSICGPQILSRMACVPTKFLINIIIKWRIRRFYLRNSSMAIEDNTRTVLEADLCLICYLNIDLPLKSILLSFLFKPNKANNAVLYALFQESLPFSLYLWLYATFGSAFLSVSKLHKRHTKTRYNLCIQTKLSL